MGHRLTCVCLAGAVLLGGCQSTDMAPIQGTAMRLDDDEQRLWTRSQEEQAMLDRSGFQADLPELEAYLNSVVAQLHPETLPGGERFRVKVLVDPTLNAFAFPNGSIYIHTGMLARIENEAQLATVLAHELTHTTHRHGVKGMRSLKNKTALLVTFTVGTGGYGGVVALLGGFGTLAAVSGYAQDLEREADEQGFRRLRAAGYDPRESAKVFRTLLAESKRTKHKEPFFFGSHPRLTERIASYDRLVQALPATSAQGRTEAAAYAAQLPPVLARNAEAALQAADYDFAASSARQYLATHPDDAHVLFLLAEVHRKRAEKGDLDEAQRRCEQLRASHPDFPDTYRVLGLLHLKAGRKSEAADAFNHYLQLKPAAEDRAYIENFLTQCAPNP